MRPQPKPLGHSIGWTIQDANYVFECRWFRICSYRLVRGPEQFTYTYIEHPGSVLIVPVTPDNKVLLIHCYRFPLDMWSWEVPAGSLADRSDFTPAEVAKQELHEETGGIAARFESLGRFFLANGGANQATHIFLARDVELLAARSLEFSEEIPEVRAFEWAEIRTLLSDGTIADGDSALALLIARIHLEPDAQVN